MINWLTNRIGRKMPYAIIIKENNNYEVKDLQNNKILGLDFKSKYVSTTNFEKVAGGILELCIQSQDRSEEFADSCREYMQTFNENHTLRCTQVQFNENDLTINLNPNESIDNIDF